MFAVFTAARKATLAAVALVSLTILTACEMPSTSGGPTIAPGDPVPVALLVPRGSATPGDAVLAQSLENAARMAVSDLGNVTVDLRVYDTAGNAATAAAVASQAVNDGARIILGPVYAEAANAVGNAVKGAGVNVLAFSNNPTIAGGNVFILGPTFDNTANRLAAFAASQGKGNIVAVHGTDLAGSLGRNAIQGAAGRTSASLAGSVPYELSQQGVIAAVPQVRDTVANSGADSIFLTSTTAGALPLFTQLLPEAGLSPSEVQYIGLTRWDIPPQTLELPGVQGGWFALPDPVKSNQLLRQARI